MNVKSFLFTLLETPMSYIDWNDKMFLFEVLEGYTSAYAMNKKHIKEYEKKNYQIQIMPNNINLLPIKI